jgi:2'-5' RNA ligase
VEPASARLFIGLRPDAALAQELVRAARASLEGVLDDLRATDARDVHLTLCFLGAVGAAQALALERELGPALAGLAAPRLELAGTGAFPARGNERVLWAGVREAEGAAGRLARIRERIGAALGACGREDPELAGAAPWIPHLTLARVARARRPRIPERFHALELAGAFVPRAVELCRSLGAAGPQGRYPVVRSFPLAAS